jgi:hypothetical protein
MFTMMLNIIEEIFIFTSNLILLHSDLYYVKIKRKTIMITSEM